MGNIDNPLLMLVEIPLFLRNTCITYAGLLSFSW
jgi:hypothetical protein